MHPVLFEVGPLVVYSYGFMMALGFIAGGWVLAVGLERRGLVRDFALPMVVWAAVGGLLGARLLYIATERPTRLSEAIAMLTSGSGYVWYGGLISGVGALSLFIFRHQLPWRTVMDALAPGIALGHSLGRIGCHLAGDGDWGPVTDGAFGVAYIEAVVGWPFPAGTRVHPTPLYESAAYLLIFLLLFRRARVGCPPGANFWAYLLLAGVARFTLEFVRVNPPLAFGLSQAQWISVALVAVAAVLLARGRETLPGERP